MFGLLLKKQLYEAFRSWFYNPKTGKARSKGGTAGMLLLFLLLLVVVLGGSFTAIAIGIAAPLYAAGAGHLYYILFGLIAMVLGLFGSVFNSYASLYLARDNDLLLSMPIAPGVLVASRLCSTYLMGVLYAGIAFVPGVVVWQIVVGFDAASLLGSLGMLLEITLLVWVLSCLLGYAVARISLRVKRRSLVTVLAALAFMGLYYLVYFKAQVLIQDMVANAAVYGARVRGSAYLLYTWGQNGVGDLPAVLGWLLGCMALAGLTWLLMSRTFLRVAIATPAGRKKAAGEETVRVRSLPAALLQREFSRFTSSANYMLNCGLGTLFLPAAGIFLLIKGSAVVSVLSELPVGYWGVIGIGIAGVGWMLAAMNDTAAPAVSLEGKGLWLVQSLPIEPWQVLRAKLRMQLILTEVPMLLLCAGIAALPLEAEERVLSIVLCLLYPAFSAAFNLCIGLKMPILHWTNEIVPLKQSGGVAVALFGGWGAAVLLVGGYIGLRLWLGAVHTAVYAGVFAAVLAAATALLCRWLQTKGAALLQALQ